MGIRTTLIEIAKNVIKWDKKLEIYTNGEDNKYPDRMEAFKNNSVTATMASEIMTQYLIGKGFGEADNIQIGGGKLIDFANEYASDLVDNKGAFIHVIYDANLEPADFELFTFKHCRVGEKDSKEYNGKILVSKNWDDKKLKPTIYNVFNPDKEVLKYQMNIKANDSEADIITKVKKYNGQVMYVNLMPKYYYPLSRIDSVWHECDNEKLGQTYRNTLLRRGFFGKTLIITKPLVDESFIVATPNTPEYRIELQKQESERDNFKKTITDFIGAENTGGALHMELEFSGDNFEEAIVFKNIESNIDDKLFAFTESICTEKILMAYNNLPISLVKSPDSALLGNSGESLRVAKETYWENTTKERNKVEQTINDLLRMKSDYVYTNYISVLPLIEPKTTTTNVNN